MTITKELLLKSIQDMPEKFSIDQLLEKLLLLQKIEIGLEQSKSEHRDFAGRVQKAH